MTPQLKMLRMLIDEDNYPTFEDSYLLDYLNTGKDLIDIAKILLLEKANIGEIRLGDVTIKTPQGYFKALYNQLKGKYYDKETNEIKAIKTRGRVAVRYDKRN